MMGLSYLFILEAALTLLELVEGIPKEFYSYPNFSFTTTFLNLIANHFLKLLEAVIDAGLVRIIFHNATRT